MVGAWNTLFGFATFAAFTAAIGDSVPYGYVVACGFSSLLNISVAFLGYKWLVFRTKGNYFREWARCLAVYGTGIIWGALALPILVQLLRVGAGLGRSAPYVAGALLTCFGVIYNFLGHKKFSFATANAVGIEEASS